MPKVTESVRKYEILYNNYAGNTSQHIANLQNFKILQTCVILKTEDYLPDT